MDEPGNPSTNTASRRSTLKKQHTNRKKTTSGKQKYANNGGGSYAYSPNEYNGNYSAGNHSNAAYPTHSNSSLYGGEGDDEDINIHNVSTLSKSRKFTYNDVSPQSNSNHYAQANLVNNYGTDYTTSSHSLCNDDRGDPTRASVGGGGGGGNYYFDLDLCRDLNEEQHYYEPI
uniref:Uncharacterized protein n=1 Tax=Cacopsylla melanoneura TaxID=428564 RepID=A0A8D8PT66_9HEMI